MPQRLATILGDFEGQNIGHPREYFIERGIFLDCRGEVTISERSMWGYHVMVLTGSHRLDDRNIVYRPVTVEAGAWICSGVILYNCHIGQGAVVAAGTVVNSRDVPAWVLVEGNPACIVARYNRQVKKWWYLRHPDLLERKHGISQDSLFPIRT
jgi:acetyltransferase-like isoleucine patch superfamily enzyme